MTSNLTVWYLTRATGLMCLVGFTGVMVLGILASLRARPGRLPRFLVSGLHRNLSLFTVALLVAHIGAAILDSYAPIGIIDVFVPFHTPYRPLWVGFGTIAFDLLLALVVTSLLRSRLGYRAWRVVHWAAYASWPTAVLHGLGTGTDTKARWVLALTGGCVVAVLAALAVRVSAAGPLGRRVGVGGLALAALGLLAWVGLGPLQPNWARAAGTPANLLGGKHSTGSAVSTAGGSVSNFGASALRLPVSGTLAVRQQSSGAVLVELRSSFAGPPGGSLLISLTGAPAGDGGVSLQSGQVALGPSSQPALYRGSVTSLTGQGVAAALRDSSGHSAAVSVTLQTNPSAGTFTGELTLTPGSP